MAKFQNDVLKEETQCDNQKQFPINLLNFIYSKTHISSHSYISWNQLIVCHSLEGSIYFSSWYIILYRLIGGHSDFCKHRIMLSKHAEDTLQPRTSNRKSLFLYSTHSAVSLKSSLPRPVQHVIFLQTLPLQYIKKLTKKKKIVAFKPKWHNW